MICLHIISRQDAIAYGLKRYFTGAECPAGHVAERSVYNFGCVVCAKEIARARYSKNIDSERAKSRERAASEKYKKMKKERRQKKEYREREYALERKRNPKKYSVKKQDFSLPDGENNKERKRLYAKMYYHHNKEKIRSINQRRADKRKEYVREWAKDYRNTKEGKAICFMRKCISRCISNKTDRTHNLLGYTRNELMSHIESQFEEWMNWENHGKWHIDHIIPISWFIKNGQTCPKKINALSNLVPISAKQNLSKGAKIK